MVVDERQKALLDLCYERPRDLDELSQLLGQKREDLMRVIEELKAKGVLEVEKELVDRIELTAEGEQYLTSMLPEEKLGILLKEFSELTLSEALLKAQELGIQLSNEEVKIGVMHLARLGAIRVDGQTIALASEQALADALEEARTLRSYISALVKGFPPPPQKVEALKRRRIVSVRKTVKIRVYLTERAREMMREGKLVYAKVATALTPEIIASGEWRNMVFKEYDVSIPPPRLYPGRKHPYLEFLDSVRELLAEMGFEEMRGPHVELEFWNFDALFQAQDHPAREIHDTFFLKTPERGKVGDLELVERVRAVHENGWSTGSLGWGYSWDPTRAMRLILRTQTTAVSARTLYRRGDGEYRCFALDRVFRPENLDAKHSMEFYQLEGIIVSKKVTLKHLIGFFNELAKKLNLGEVKIKPAYFPFTEPSVEGFIKHPKLGWMEVFPGGMFRPEVLRPLGVKECNVAAWGIGIDRIAMAVLGIDDIRLLFSQDLEFLRNWRIPVRW